MSKILVVESEASLRRFYERELARKGDTVLTADDAVDAYVGKSSDTGELRSTVHELLRSRPYQRVGSA